MLVTKSRKGEDRRARENVTEQGGLIARIQFSRSIGCW